jgi:predicted nicotinamide N-methyase
MGKGKKKPQGGNGSGSAPVPTQAPLTAPSASSASASTAASSSPALTFMSLKEPSTMTALEYEDLLEQIRTSFNRKECAVELLEAARYNDIDIVRAVLSVYPTLITTIPSSDTPDNDDDNDGAQPEGEVATTKHETTPLHYAAANGHTGVVQLLKQCGADPMAVNPQQNTPLHWAAANGHLETVRILLNPSIATLSSSTITIDVLQRNAAGRSILTEGFSSQNHNVVQLLLEHESASEEKLVATGSGKKAGTDDDNEHQNENDKDDNPNGGNDTATSIVHDLVFGGKRDRDPSPNPSLSSGGAVRIRIREQVMARTEQDSILGQDSPDQDATGLGIWAAALVTAAWMVEEAGGGDKNNNMLDRFANRTVIELGAGCGVPGMVVAASGGSSSNNNDPSEDSNTVTPRLPPSKVYLTDFNSRTVENLRFNAQLNQDQTTAVDVRYMNWQDPATWPDERLDFCIGSDLIYQSDMVPLLVQTVAGLLKKDENSRFLYVAPDTGRKGQEGLVAALEQAGLELDTEREAPAAYSANPLYSQDEEECFLHFNELSSMRFKLYEFRWRRDGNYLYDGLE